MNPKLRLFIPILVITAAAVGGLFLSKPHPVSATPQPLFATYTTGSFTFSTPLELQRPASMVFFQSGGEPEIQTDVFGNIYVTAIQGVPGGVDLWKSTDNGATFVYLGQPDGAQDHCPTLPQCVGLGGGDDQIDVSPGGYLYISSLWEGNVTMSTSYDGATGGVQPGQKWEVDPAAAGVIGGDDRQWVAAYGPETVGMTFAANSGVENLGLFFVKSTDGGKTYGPAVEITGATAINSVNVEGNLVVDPYTGTFYTVYIPASNDNVIDLASSTDGGMTWTVTTAYTGPAGTTNRGVFPILAVDRGGNLHLVFTNSTDDGNDNNCHVFLTSTANPTAATPTWTSAVQIDNNGAATGTACQAWITAGSPGIVDVTWLGQSGPNPNTPNPNGHYDWHVFFAQVTNALTGSPTIAANMAESSVVHDDSICFDGGGCASNGTPHGEPGNRDMLEYYTMRLDNNGNARIAYSDSIDSCDPSNCTTNAWFTQQTSGPNAYNPPARPAPATFAANFEVAPPSTDNSAEPNAWVDTFNCIYGGSIGGALDPMDYLSTDAGNSFTSRAVVEGTGIHGGDFHLITVPNADGSRPDQIYTADLGITTVHIGKSVDRNATFTQPGMDGAAGEVSVSSDRMWLSGDRGVPTATDQTVYLMDHEFTSEVIRFSALTDDVAWSPFTSGCTSPELLLPPDSTLPNTNPGPTFVDHTTHNVFGCFAASTVTTNTAAPPFGKMPDAWEAVGAPPAAEGLPPGPMTNYPVFKGVIDSPTSAPSPAPTPDPRAATIGTHIGNLWPTGDVDSAGNVYMAWAMNNARPNAVQSDGTPTETFDVWIAASHDGGQNFYGPFRVSSGTGTAIFPWVRAGDEGRVDVVWYQSNSLPPPIVANPTSPGSLTGGSNNMPTGSTWNVMFAQSLNANSREPVFTVSTASDHVIHLGSISNGGLFGSSDRTLLDFFQVAIGPDGLANIFCSDNPNPGNGATGNLHTNYMRQIGGPLALENPSTVTCLPIPVLTSVVSEFVHTGVGPFDVNIPLPPNSSPRAVECRSSASLGAGNYTLIFTFTANLTSVTGATVSSGTGSVSSSAIGPNPNQYTVSLTGVTDQQYITVTLNSVVDATGASGNIVSPKLGILVGDENSSGRVDAADVSSIRQQTLTTVSNSNFRNDINCSGRIDAADVSIARQDTLHSLPSTP